MKRFSVVFLLYISVAPLFSQPQKEYTASDILLGLQKLNVLGSVLYIAAHPDDENTRLLAYWANEAKLRTAYLALTRGDGGQNLIGKERGELLGLIRTNELLAARKIDHAEQYFTRANDFGYSKSPEETLRLWNRDSVLADVVWVIRNLKPDIIVCRFPTTGEGGHGHHTASAILAQEAFEAAADANRFPEQLKYVAPWQTKRLFWNTFNFGSINTTSKEQIQLDAGVFNPLLGQYYGEIASEGRSMHKSQGFGTAKTRGTAIEYFKQLAGSPAKENLFEGIDCTWNRFAETSGLSAQIKDCIAHFNPAAPQESVNSLGGIYRSLQAIQTENKDLLYWKAQKTKEVQEILLACAGFWAEAYSDNYWGVPGQKMTLTAQALSENGTPLTIDNIQFQTEQELQNKVLKPNELYSVKKEITLPSDMPYSTPYWLQYPHSATMYVVPDLLLRGRPMNVPPLSVTYNISVAGLHLAVTRPVVYKYVDHVRGEVYRPFEVLPPVTINIADKVLVYSDLLPKTVHLLVTANQDGLKGTLSLKVPDGWTVSVAKPDFELAKAGDQVQMEAQIAPIKGMTPKNDDLLARVNIGDKSYGQAIYRINYDHIPALFTLSPASAKLVFVDLKKNGEKIGYVPGAGDDVATCLKQIGYQVTELTDDMLANADLTAYSAIVTGVRAYNVNSHLKNLQEHLMDYVKQGGNLVVQYNTNSKFGPLTTELGPYPFTVSSNRVTDETAPIAFLKPTHVVLNYPNKITADDFKDWIQERGIYFADNADKRYEAILGMHDANEPQRTGSLITAKYGKGNFVYTGLVFFRELPAGVPGAYRLFANLLSMPPNEVK